MTTSIGDASAQKFRRDGIIFPFRVLDENTVRECRDRLACLEAREGGQISEETNFKPHLLLPWISELVRHPAILDVVETVLGPNLLCWMSNFFIKEARDGKFISWHQDSTYWGLSSPDVVTAWVALSHSTPENGCMRVVPGTHHVEQVPHRDTFAGNNMLSRGQEIAVEVDQSQAVDVVLKPGEMSLHHVRIFHGSEPNESDGRRIGFAIRYIPTHLRQIGARTSALLVRGEDHFQHFDPEPIPAREFGSENVAFHAEAMRKLHEVTHAGIVDPA